MKLNIQLFNSTILLIFSVIFIGQAQANTGAQVSFDILYPSNGQIQCFVCHNSVPTVPPVQLSIYGSSYRAKGGSKNGGTNFALKAIEALDTDGDGFANIFEIRSGSLLSSAASRPISSKVDATKKVMARSTLSTVQAIVTTPITDLYTATNDTYTLAKGREILSGVSVQLTLSNAGAVILTFADAPVPVDAKIYEVPATGAAIQPAFTVSTSGEVTVTTVSATPTLIVERTAPPAAIPPPTVSCMFYKTSTTFAFALLLLSLGFIVKRKRA